MELAKQHAVFVALQRAEEQERVKLSQELHDSIGARLSGVKMLLEGFVHNVNDETKKEENKDVADKIKNILNELIVDIRRTSRNLQPAFFDGKQLEPALEEFISQLNKVTNCKFEIIGGELPDNLNNNLKLNCYHIATELIMNIVKHAQANEAMIQLNSENDILLLMVEDNGKGFNTSKTNGGKGLLNIRNRVEFCNGKLNIDSSDVGSTIIIEFPLQFN